MKIRTYSELITFDTFKDRFNYLKLGGAVGQDTFGFDRYLNQAFYKSKEWKGIRNQIILRDNSCDLGIPERDIYDRVYVHHMNPISVGDLENEDYLMNPEFLICTTKQTHNAIHYGNLDSTIQIPKERTKGDTCPWKVY